MTSKMSAKLDDTITALSCILGSINIAYGKPTHQFPGTYCESRLVSPEAPGGGRYCYNSSLAVDGDINTCSRTTDNGTRPYGLLIVDLEQPYTLHSIKIYRHMSDGISL